MINPKENEFTRFVSEDEELDFLRSCGLVTARAVKSKAFYYKGAYTRWPVFCRVIGKTDSGAAVISLPGGEHCINTDYLSEMQAGSSRLYRDACQINGIGTFVALDFETTGLSPQSDRIIEIGAVKYSDGKELSRFQSLVDPGMPISEYITELTGITNSELDSAPELTEVLPQFLEFLDSLPIVAHNAAFDKGFLDTACAQHGISLNNELYDTLALSRWIFPGLPNYRLQTLVSTFDIDGGRAHRALFDACAVAQLFELCKTIPFAANKGSLFQ